MDPDRLRPIIVTLTWYCGHAVGPPRWQGTEAYEPDECTGEGVVALAWDDLEWDEGGGPPEPPCWINHPVFCTKCHQELQEPDHFDGWSEAFKHVERVRKARDQGNRDDG